MRSSKIGYHTHTHEIDAIDGGTTINEIIEKFRYMYQNHIPEHIPDTNIDKIIEFGAVHLVQQVSTDNLETSNMARWR